MFSSPLRRALDRGLKRGGDLAKELGKLDSISVQSKKDAQAICKALRTLPVTTPPGERPMTSALHALTGLFQDVEGPDAPAFDVLYREGLPELLRIFAIGSSKDDADEDDLLFILKILALYGSREGTETIVNAARRPFHPDAYMWHPILASFASPHHPQRDYVFDALADPLPEGFVAVGLLDVANGAAIEHGLERHPFDSAAGRERLERWLEDSDPKNFSYAHSATAALPFVGAGDRLFALAERHPDESVRMEAAWAAAKIGRESGFDRLVEFCRDLNLSATAMRYLAELDRPDLVPEAALDPTFQALAGFSNWLAHPNELGRAPDELEVVDHRTLDWPPGREPRPFWIVRYRLKDRTGLGEDDVECGLVGSVTWCFFTYKMHQRPPEDVYAIHCCWEMEHAGLIDENEPSSPDEYATMLGQWTGDRLEGATIECVSEVSPGLGIPSRFVALASAKRNGEAGWVALDGQRSAWYPADEQPEGTGDSVVLKLHIGRQLLGFRDPPDRKRFLAAVAAPSERSPREIVSAYERLLDASAEASRGGKERSYDDQRVLSQHFDAYVRALVETEGMHAQEASILAYERFLAIAAGAAESVRGSYYDSTFDVLCDRFGAHVDALISRGRSAEALSLVESFAPYREHNLGYGQLGSAAFKAGNRDLAETFLTKLRDGMPGYARAKGMSQLAEIWHGRGESSAARDLLVDCLRKLQGQIRESKYDSDRRTFAGDYGHHRATYLRLFSGGETELAKLGLPSDPLA